MRITGLKAAQFKVSQSWQHNWTMWQHLFVPMFMLKHKQIPSPTKYSRLEWKHWRNKTFCQDQRPSTGTKNWSWVPHSQTAHPSLYFGGTAPLKKASHFLSCPPRLESNELWVVVLQEPQKATGKNWSDLGLGGIATSALPPWQLCMYWERGCH